MTANDVITDAVNDARQVIGSTALGQAILLDYVDRIHKDCLHSSLFKSLNVAVASVQTVPGTVSYTLPVSNIRRPISVYDRTSDRIVLPLGLTMAPNAIGGAQVPTPGQAPEMPRPAARIKFTTSALPEYYRLVGVNTLYLYPAPSTVSSLEFSYEQTVPTLTTATETLTVPDDGKDMMVAGVNMLVAIYMKLETMAQIWYPIYTAAKSGQSLS